MPVAVVHNLDHSTTHIGQKRAHDQAIDDHYMAVDDQPLSKHPRYDFVHHSAPGNVSVAKFDLASLPDDILLLIIANIDVNDILALRMTNKRLADVSRRRWVWLDAHRRHVVDQRISSTELEHLSTKQLEIRALRIARFHQNWSSPQPKHRHSLEFDVADSLLAHNGPLEAEEAPPRPFSDPTLPKFNTHEVTQVFFPPGHNGELIITVIAPMQPHIANIVSPARHRIVCWEVPLSSSQVYVVAERTFPPNCHIQYVAVNDDPQNEAMLAVVFTPADNSNPQMRTIEAWKLDKFHGRFDTLRHEVSHFNRLRPLVRLSGDWLILGEPVAMWSWRVLGRYFILSAHSPSPVPDNILTARVIRHHILIVRQSHFQLIPIPQFDAEGKQIRVPNAVGAYLHLSEPAKEAVIVAHSSSSWSSKTRRRGWRSDADGDARMEMGPNQGSSTGGGGAGREEWLFDPVTILLRMSKSDTIQKYDIYPRKADQPYPSSFPFLSSNNPNPDAPPPPPPNQLPCSFTPHFTKIVSVTPSCGNLVVTPSGKGFWFEMRNVAGTGGKETQVARCLVGFDAFTNFVRPLDNVVDSAATAYASKDDTDSDSGCEIDDSPPSSSSSSSSSPRDNNIETELGKVETRGEGYWENEFVVRENPLLAVRVGMGEVESKKFGRLACADLEDTVGRVVVGGRDGKVRVLDFV